MTYNETEILIKKYLNGETTAEEERLLACEVAREDAPDDWKVIAGMLGELTVDEALFDQMMAERKSKPRIVRLWPWVAAACVAALLIVFLGPPREETITEPQIAKVDPKTKAVEVKETEPKEQDMSQAISPIKRRKKRPKIEHPRSTDISTSEDEALPLTAEVIVPTAEKTMVSTNRPMRTIHIAPGHVVYVNDGANQVPTTEMFTVSDLRTRGQRLTLEVKQQMQETNPF